MSREQIIVIDSSSALMPAVFALRHAVFVVEQAVPPEIEVDEFDASATHLVTLHDHEVIGTLRLVADGEAAKVGRVAVRAAARKNGIGSRLMARAAAIASDKGFREIVLHAQVSVIGFYRRLGYREEGNVFDEAGIPHVAMRKSIA
jgi:predicted GNAT family N-acyltransferase